MAKRWPSRLRQKGITSLPDEVSYTIFQGVPNLWDDMDTHLRITLPLVCKKWREVLYLQNGQSTRTYIVTFG